MATHDAQHFIAYVQDDIYEESGDNESLASLETDDGLLHSAERILAQLEGKNGLIWYLVKWHDCPVIRSSWEGADQFNSVPWLLEAWFKEHELQEAGKSPRLDLIAFDKAVEEEEVARSERRVLRRLRRKLKRVLSIVAT
jgi:hypothetical protein